MADIKNQNLGNEINLKSLHEKAIEALQLNQLKNSLKFSNEGLKMARLDNNSHWIEEFSKLIETIETRSIILKNATPNFQDMLSVENLEGKVIESFKNKQIETLGLFNNNILLKLKNSGYETINDIFLASIDDLIKIKGIGKITALKIQDSIKEYLENTLKTIEMTEIENKKSKNTKSISLEQPTESIFPIFNENNDNNKEINNEEEKDIVYKKIYETSKLNDDKSPILKLPIKSSLNDNLENKNYSFVLDALKNQGFIIIAENKYPLPGMNDMIIQIIGCKLIRKNNKILALEIIPFVLLENEDIITIKDDIINVEIIGNGLNKGKNEINCIISKLIEIQQQQYKKILKGEFNFQKINESFGLNFKIISKKKQGLFFLTFNGKIINVMINPVIIFLGLVKSLDKSISFPFLRKSNVYIINIEKIKDFLIYIEKKVDILANLHENQHPINQFDLILNKLFKRIQFTSYPMILIGLFLLSLIILKQSHFLEFFIPTCNAFLILYSISIVTFILIFKRDNNNLKQAFKLDLQERTIKLDNSYLKIIKKNFSNDFLDQFYYEMGK
ncbi:MAG: helix-hairpin-helix domain-containing protein, partial [Promethearchaeota archaeon]